MGLFTFIDRFRASSSDRSPWGDFFFEPVSVRSASGMRVSPDGALRLVAVYACVRILSETMASLPVVVYRQRKDGGKDRVTDHWLYGLLARKPNRFQNPFEWREMLQGHLALRGNAFCQIIANPKGEITELMPIHPDRVRMEVMEIPSGSPADGRRLGEITHAQRHGVQIAGVQRHSAKILNPSGQEELRAGDKVTPSGAC